MALKSKTYFSTAILTIALTACGGGSGGSTTNPPLPPPADTVAPSVSFNPATLTVESGMTGTSTLTATDNVGVTSGPTVTCTNNGSFSGSTFTAPTVTADTTSVCTATAGDAAGNSGTATLTITIPNPNEAPVASASSNVTTVTEGQPFRLDASGSTDADGDTLTYSWAQTSGTAVTIATPADAVQSLTAPDLTADETLEFEVTVSDGTVSSMDTIAINVEDFQPLITTSEPSSFNGGNSLEFVRGMVANDSGGYTLFWVKNLMNAPSPTSYQNFTVDGAKTGGQVDGEFQAAGNQIVGVNADVIQSGNTLYYVNAFTDSANMLGTATHRGLISGSVSGFGDQFVSSISPLRPKRDTVAIGTNQLVNITTGDVSGANHFANSYIIQPDGTSIMTALAGPGVHDIDGSTIAAFEDNSYVGIWAEANADGDGYGINMQRVASGGTLLGSTVTVNEKTTSDQLDPNAARMQDGNVFVAWGDNDGGNIFNSQSKSFIKGRIIRPDGTFATAEFEIDSNEPNANKPVAPHVTALNTNQVLVTWRLITFRLGTPETFDIKAQVFNADGTTGSNVFEVVFDQGSESARGAISLNSVALADNRVVLAWTTQGAPEESYTVGFYPIGKE